MRPQTLAVVLLALVSGLAAVWGVRSLLKKPAAAVEETVSVVVATADLPQDEPIDVKQVEVRRLPKSQAPEGWLASAEGAASRIPAITMLKGEAVVKTKLLPEGAKPETIPVVFALVDLLPRVPIDAKQVEVREIPKSRTPAGLLTSAEDATSRSPLMPIPKGEPVVEPKLFPKETRPDMALLVPPGMRAFTIQTPKFSPILAGLLRRGNRVDVLLSAAPPGGGKDDVGKGDAVASTVVQNVELLDVHENGQLPEGRNDANAVTLLVTPHQAAVLDLAQGRGVLQLTLRNDADGAATVKKTATLDDLGLGNVPVVVALVDLPTGVPIDAECVEIREVPESRAPEDRLTSVEEAESRVPSRPIRKGEFVVEPRLSPRRDRPDLVASIPPGMRAFTIQSSRFSPTLAGLMRRGNRVDVLLTVTPRGSRNDRATTTTALLDAVGKPTAVHSTTVEPGSGTKDDPNAVSTTVLQNVELLYVHTNSRPEDDLEGTISVTLLVTPRQAAILNLAQERGSLHLSLRNDDDGDAPLEEATATIADVAPIFAPTSDVLTIRTLRGTLAGRDQITVHHAAGAKAGRRQGPGGPRPAPPGPSMLSSRP